MKKRFFIVCLMLFAVIANAQMDSTFYYYQGGKVRLHYNKAVIHLGAAENVRGRPNQIS